MASDTKSPFINQDQPQQPQQQQQQSAGSYLGFANLPNQVHRKSVKKGFEFTLMVVGESGLGKSTLIKSLFSSSGISGVYAARKQPNVADQLTKTIAMTAATVDIEERGV